MELLLGSRPIRLNGVANVKLRQNILITHALVGGLLLYQTDQDGGDRGAKLIRTNQTTRDSSAIMPDKKKAGVMFEDILHPG